MTAYTLLYKGSERGRAVQTEVTFRPLAPAELEGYVGSREWEDKAGGYAVQGLAAAFVRAVRGSYTNIVGLPLCEVLEDLDALGALPPDWALGPEKSDDQAQLFMSLHENLIDVGEKIAAAARAAGRDPSTVTLLAVSKTVPAERVRAAMVAGHDLFGENYAQELRDKAREVTGARWHFVGPLQRNKVKYVVGVAELIHSIDSPALLDEDRGASREARRRAALPGAGERRRRGAEERLRARATCRRGARVRGAAVGAMRGAHVHPARRRAAAAVL